MKIISRAKAKELGLKYYFTGKPCSHGHIENRQVSNCTCCECQRNVNNKRRSQPTVKKKINKQRRLRYNSDEKRRSAIKELNATYRRKPSSIDSASEYRKKPSSRVRANQIRRARYKESKEYRASHLIRINIKRAIKKSGANFPIPRQNYTASQLKSRIEFQFKDGMTWENHGEWHIDHKKPVARFIRDGVINPHLINALSNLQPLWATDNHKKGDRF